MRTSNVKGPSLVHFIGIALLGCLFTYAFWGILGLQGFAIGAGAGAFNMVAMWGAIKILGNFHRGIAQSGGSDVLILIAFLMKLPIYIIAAMAVQRMGGTASNGFLAAIAIVYACLIWWGRARA